MKIAGEHHSIIPPMLRPSLSIGQAASRLQLKSASPPRAIASWYGSIQADTYGMENSTG